MLSIHLAAADEPAGAVLCTKVHTLPGMPKGGLQGNRSCSVSLGEHDY